LPRSSPPRVRRFLCRSTAPVPTDVAHISTPACSAHSAPATWGTGHPLPCRRLTSPHRTSRHYPPVNSRRGHHSSVYPPPTSACRHSHIRPACHSSQHLSTPAPKRAHSPSWPHAASRAQHMAPGPRGTPPPILPSSRPVPETPHTFDGVRAALPRRRPLFPPAFSPPLRSGISCQHLPRGAPFGVPYSGAAAEAHTVPARPQGDLSSLGVLVQLRTAVPAPSPRAPATRSRKRARSRPRAQRSSCFTPRVRDTRSGTSDTGTWRHRAATSSPGPALGTPATLLHRSGDGDSPLRPRGRSRSYRSSTSQV